MRPYALFAFSLVLLPTATLGGLFLAQLPPRLYACSTFRIGWMEDEGVLTAEDMGMVQVDLFRQGELVQRLACTDVSASFIQLHIPCDVPPSSDYALRYTSPANPDALYAFGVTIHAPPPILRAQYKRMGEVSLTTIPTPNDRRAPQEVDPSSPTSTSDTDSSAPTSASDIGIQPDDLGPPTLSYDSQNTSPSDMSTTSPTVTVTGSLTMRPTVARPTEPMPPSTLLMTSGAMPTRAIGVHPGLVMLWAGLMCGMVLF